jgi:hypothetical protein
MTLRDIVQKLKQADHKATIYAVKPWNIHSEAMIALEPEEGGLPSEAKTKGMEYFLEISVAQDFMEEWIKSQKPDVSLEVQCDRFISYAENDA